jgi:hypothetical protein
MTRSTKLLLAAGLLVEGVLFYAVSFVSSAQLIPSLDDAANFTNTVNVVNLLIATLAGMSVLTGIAGYRILMKSAEERAADRLARERDAERNVAERDKERASSERLAALFTQAIGAVVTAANNTDAARKTLESTSNLVNTLVDSTILKLTEKDSEVTLSQSDRDKILEAYRMDADRFYPMLARLLEIKEVELRGNQSKHPGD